MSSSVDVVVAGIVVVDHVAAPVDHLPDAGQLVLTDDCIVSIGGSAGNVAVDLSKMGISNSICGCVGDDAFGGFAKDYLKRHGVGMDCLTTVPGIATSQTLIVNVKGQDRRFIHHKGANDVFSSEHFPSDQIARSKLLYIGGFFLMDKLTAPEVRKVFQEAQKNGVITMLDVVTPGPGDYLSALEIVLPHTDVFLPNNDEAKLITGADDPVEQAEVFRKLGAKTVVITCGGKGSVLISDSCRIRAGAFPVEFVDGTGGGDAFDAGYIAGLLQNAPPRECLRLGSALGASCVQQSGATDGVFTREQLEAFLQTHDLQIEEF